MPNAPQIGALAPIAPATQGQVSPLGNFAQGLSGFGENLQQAQLQQAQTKDQINQLDDKKLAQLSQFAMANPQYASNPQAIKAVTDIFKRRGLPPPLVKDETGQRLDINALSPGKPFGSLTPQELDFLYSKDPQERAALVQGMRIQGAPPEFLQAKAQLPITASEGSAILTGLRMEMAKVADPNSGGPEGFAALVKMYAPILSKMGLDPKQLYNDPALMQALDQRAATTTQRYITLGILKPEEEMKYKQQMIGIYQGRLADQQTRTGIQQQRAATEARRVDGQVARWDAQNRGLVQNLGIAQQRLKAYLGLGPAGAGATMKYGNFLSGQLRTAQTQLDSLQNIARGYVTAGQDIPPDVAGRIENLQTQIQTLTPAVDAITNNAVQQYNATARAATGSTAIQIHPPNFQAGQAVPGEVGATFVESEPRGDGAFKIKAKDGKLYWWKP